MYLSIQYVAITSERLRQVVEVLSILVLVMGLVVVLVQTLGQGTTQPILPAKKIVQ